MIILREMRRKPCKKPATEVKFRSLHGLIYGTAPLVVGTVHDKSGLQQVKHRGIAMRGIDLLEVRLDSLAGVLLPETWPLPVIATARHPDEGGSGDLSSASRAELLHDAVLWAAAIDVELRSSRALAPVIARAHQHGRTVILSHHDFKATPSLVTLKRYASKAAAAGADLFKVATLLRDRDDLIRLIEFQAGASPVPVVAMGMGGAGRFSRLVLPGFGAPLCYGWLGRPQVPGQWPAEELKGLLNMVIPV